MIELKQSKDQLELRIGKALTQIDNQQSLIDSKAQFKDIQLLNNELKELS